MGKMDSERQNHSRSLLLGLLITYLNFLVPLFDVFLIMSKLHSNVNRLECGQKIINTKASR